MNLNNTTGYSISCTVDHHGGPCSWNVDPTSQAGTTWRYGGSTTPYSGPMEPMGPQFEHLVRVHPGGSGGWYSDGTTPLTQRQGWKCSDCGVNYAPWVPSCRCNNPEDKGLV